MNREGAPQHSRLSRRQLLLGAAAGATGSACARGKGRGTPRSDELILCGWDEVFILAIPREAGRESEARKVWSWRAADCPNLPEDMRSLFRSTDDCKPVDGGTKILITSSSTGVALVDRATKQALFHAAVTNAHSAELLPRRRIVVAASVSELGTGNRLVLFDIDKPEKQIFSNALRSAHGVVWDEKREILWALGDDELRAYRLRDWESASPKLERVGAYTLPSSGGHDLARIPATPLLFVSMNKGCWVFDRQKLSFQPHDILARAARVKSYSVNPATGRVAYVQAEGKNWWAERVHFFNPPGTLHLAGRRLYKARWNVEI